jgi:Uma2 family endonuclease
MASPLSTKLLTADEFYAQYQSNERDLELVAGRVVAVPPASWDHDVIATEIAMALREFVSRHNLGKAVAGGGFLVEHEPDTVRGAHVSFVSSERLRARHEREPYIDGGPDLAVEVVSPGNTIAEIRRKTAEYLASGSQRVWVVHPDEGTVIVYREDGTSQTRTTEDTLSSDDAGFRVDGFEFRVADIFR